MAKPNTGTVETPAVGKAADAPVYSAKELIEASTSVFKESPDIVTAALRMADVQSATVAEATEIVKKFAHKEVK